MSAQDDATRTLEYLRQAVKDLSEDQEALVHAYVERVEQLEAEVESWKNSYERAVKAGAELIGKIIEEGESANSKLP